MVDLKTELLDDKLTQADLIKLMLHNAQHMATREEVKADIDKLDKKIDKVEISLKADIEKLDKKIDKVDSKFDRLQWLIVATIVTVLSKDYILSILAKL
ncbi:MAG: hypothetical protein Q9M43_09870 [Sulfurimonas sp.]|nr:hypothetical protein [Sulfurimonas sp.]